MKHFYASTFILLSLLFNGCNPSTSNYMSFDDVCYVEEFPLSFSLSEEQNFELSIIGYFDFLIYDTLLIVTTKRQEGGWAFFSLPDCKELGSFLRRGNGPNEFAQMPNVSQARLWKEKEELFAIINDFQTDKTYKMNIDKSLSTNQLNITPLKDSLPPYLFNFVYLNEQTFMCREITGDHTQQNRYLLQNKEKNIPLSFEQLNQAQLAKGTDFNLFSTTMLCDPKGDLIVEAPIYLNHINLYSIDGSFKKTICCHKKVDNIDRIQIQPMWQWIYTYADLRVYKDFFAALYINEKMKTYEIERKKYPIIQLFDWMGVPIAELKLNRHVTSFDIDLINGFLYTFDHQTDEFCKYDIQDILKEIN